MELQLLRLEIIVLFITTLAALVLLWRPWKVGTRLIWWLLALVVIMLTVGLISRGMAGRQLPITSLYEFTLLMTWGLLITGLIALRRLNYLNPLLLLLSLLSLLLLSTASILPTTINPPVPALQSAWLTLHVATAIVAYGLLGLAFCLALIYWYLYKAVSRTDHQLSGLDNLTYRLISWGFLFLSLVLITGAIWAEEVWGSWWSWDPKETFALVTWLIYAFYLHGRRTREWKGLRAAMVAVIGFLVVIFTLFGVTFLLPGVHSYI